MTIGQIVKHKVVGISAVAVTSAFIVGVALSSHSAPVHKLQLADQTTPGTSLQNSDTSTLANVSATTSTDAPSSNSTTVSSSAPSHQTTLNNTPNQSTPAVEPAPSPTLVSTAQCEVITAVTVHNIPSSASIYTTSTYSDNSTKVNVGGNISNDGSTPTPQCPNNTAPQSQPAQ